MNNLIKITCNDGTTRNAKVTTPSGEPIPGITQIDIHLDANNVLAEVKLTMWANFEIQNYGIMDGILYHCLTGK